MQLFKPDPLHRFLHSEAIMNLSLGLYTKIIMGMSCLLLLSSCSDKDSQLKFSNPESGYDQSYEDYAAEGFTDAELKDLFSQLIKLSESQDRTVGFYQAVLQPQVEKHFAPALDADPFLTAVAWYKDTTEGNRDAMFTISELDAAMKDEAQKYVSMLYNQISDSDRMHSWKWLQKLKMVKIAIDSRDDMGLGQYYPYEPRAMHDLNQDDPWNKSNTISDLSDFEARVIAASWDKPVLIKFGLTYCIHCLLLENMGSVPAFHRAHEDIVDVYKLWWNPKSDDYAQLNAIAEAEVVKSSPWFILYENGRQIKAGYGFPDQNGDGLEDFLELIEP